MLVRSRRNGVEDSATNTSLKSNILGLSGDCEFFLRSCGMNQSEKEHEQPT